MIVDENFNPVWKKMNAEERREYAKQKADQEEGNALKNSKSVTTASQLYEERVRHEREMLGLTGRGK